MRVDEVAVALVDPGEVPAVVEQPGEVLGAVVVAHEDGGVRLESELGDRAPGRVAHPGGSDPERGADVAEPEVRQVGAQLLALGSHRLGHAEVDDAPAVVERGGAARVPDHLVAGGQRLERGVGEGVPPCPVACLRLQPAVALEPVDGRADAGRVEPRLHEQVDRAGDRHPVAERPHDGSEEGDHGGARPAVVRLGDPRLDHCGAPGFHRTCTSSATPSRSSCNRGGTLSVRDVGGLRRPASHGVGQSAPGPA